MAERPVTPDPGIDVDPERLAACAGDFEDLTARAAAVSAALSSALGEGAPPWGDDEIGRAFAAVHGEQAIRARELVEGVAGELAAMGDRFARAAQAYRAGDDAAADDVTGAGAGD